jgi:hypothetical protein
MSTSTLFFSICCWMTQSIFPIPIWPSSIKFPSKFINQFDKTPTNSPHSISRSRTSLQDDNIVKFTFTSLCNYRVSHLARGHTQAQLQRAANTQTENKFPFFGHVNYATAIRRSKTKTKKESTRKVQREKFTSGAERWNSLTAHTQHVVGRSSNVELLRAAPDIGNFCFGFSFSSRKFLSLSRQSRLFSLILTFDET